MDAETEAQMDMIRRLGEGRDPPEGYQAGKCKECGYGFFMKGNGKVPSYCGGMSCSRRGDRY